MKAGQTTCRSDSPNSASHPPGAEEVPEQEPHWDYNTVGEILDRDWFLTCLLASIHKAVLKPVNYSKLSEIIQNTKESSSTFLEHLANAVTAY